jgi:DNA-binding NtrC family response regulator
VKVDVRIIASTNRDLAAKIEDQTFREDLFYRLNVLSLEMPSLRERPEDIPLLIQHFLEKYSKEFGKPLKRASDEVIQIFLSHPWRGNVRELENLVSRAVLMSPGEVIREEDLDWRIRRTEECLVPAEVTFLPYKEAKAQVLEKFNREYVSRVLIRNNNNVTKAARECGLERQALQQVMRRYTIRNKELLPNEDAE